MHHSASMRYISYLTPPFFLILLVLKLELSRITMSIPWVHDCWWPGSLCFQFISSHLLSYYPGRINGSLSSEREDFNKLHHLVMHDQGIHTLVKVSWCSHVSILFYLHLHVYLYVFVAMWLYQIKNLKLKKLKKYWQMLENSDLFLLN